MAGTVTPEIVGLDMKMYPITEVELTSITSKSTLRAVFFALAAALAAFAGSVWLSVRVEGGPAQLVRMPEEMQVLYNLGIPILLVVAGLFSLGGLVLWLSTRLLIRKLKKRSD